MTPRTTFRARARIPARALAAGAAITLLAGPAWADCAQDISALDAEIVAAETGAAQGGELPATQHQEEVLSEDGAAAQESDMPATEHQEEVLSGDQAPMETAAGSTGDVETITQHQREAVRALDDQERTQVSELVDEAREMAQAGDEQGCQAKLEEIRAMLATR